jgi:hypothetical protein
MLVVVVVEAVMPQTHQAVLVEVAQVLGAVVLVCQQRKCRVQAERLILAVAQVVVLTTQQLIQLKHLVALAL